MMNINFADILFVLIIFQLLLLGLFLVTQQKGNPTSPADLQNSPFLKQVWIFILLFGL
jgi:hypothetical protein